MFFQLATGYAGAWYGVDPFDQPGVELGKQLTYAAMGRPGYECRRPDAAAVRAPTRRESRTVHDCLTVPSSRPTFTRDVSSLAIQARMSRHG